MKQRESALVEWAKEKCKSCMGLRQEKVKIVRVSSWLSCPFKENAGGRTQPKPSCMAGSGVCVAYDITTKCPLKKSALYLDGEVFMFEKTKYKSERR